MMVRLSALGTSSPLPLQGNSWYSFLLDAESTLGPIVQLEGFVQMTNPTTSMEIEPVTFQLVAWHLNYATMQPTPY
jgi:hypothetical protein